MKSFLAVLVLIQIAHIYGTNVANFFRCFAWDTACVTELKVRSSSFYEIPDLGNVKLDPILVEYVKHEQDGLTLQIENTKFEGFRNYLLDDFRFHSNTNTTRAKYHTDVFVNGRYKIDGSLFFVPVQGAGEFWLSLKNLEVEIRAPELVYKSIDGVNYVEAKEYTLNYNVQDEEFKFNDDYYGNGIFNDLMSYLLNYNWKFVKSEFGKNFISKVQNDMTKTYKNSFLNPPQLRFLSK